LLQIASKGQPKREQCKIIENENIYPSLLFNIYLYATSGEENFSALKDKFNRM